MSGWGTALLLAALGAAQLLPPPLDGDIRTAYWDLQNVTDVWLTLEPRSATGEHAPVLSFTARFRGKRQTPPPDDVEVQASAGLFWAPRAELWFDLDGHEVVNLSAKLPSTSLLEGTPDYWSGRLSMDVMHRMALARRITGSSLGFPFELSASQQRALRAWLERIDPGGLPPVLRPRD